jgi:hypothetical protein
LIRFVAEARPSGPTLPDLFSALITQLDLDPEDIPAFGDECGMEISVCRLPSRRQSVHEDAA